MTASTLNEFAQLVGDENSSHWDYDLNKLTISQRVQIAKEYNETKNPSLEQTIVASSISFDRYYEKIEDKGDAEQIMQAYNKCAQNLASAKGAKIDSEKYHLGRNIKSFVCANSEYADKGFEILDKYLTDVDVIDPIRSCMSRNNSLMDRGFAAIHKSADSVCAKVSDDKGAKRQLNLVFADLYNFNGHLESGEMIDKVTSYFSEFEKQMDPDYCNLDYICDGVVSYAKDNAIKEKMTVLAATFAKWKKGKEPFEVIYAGEKDRHLFMDKVQQKVRARTKARGDVYFSGGDCDLLNRISEKDDYLQIKEEGKSGDKDTIARNKILMQARREGKNQGK